MYVHMRRTAASAGKAAAAAAAAATGLAVYHDEETRQSVTIGTVGPVCRLFVRGANHLHVHDGHHLERSLARPAGTGLLSVCNHIATIDDPHLLAAVVPARLLLRGAAEMRWAVCGDALRPQLPPSPADALTPPPPVSGHDVCFREGSMLKKWAEASKALPIVRGAGIWQKELDTIIAKLQQGDWVHYFPEGKIRQDGRIHPFRRGVGRLVASVEEPQRLQVLPFYHVGLDRVQPTTPGSTSILSRPQLGTHIHVIFGEPVDLSHLLQLRGEPPFDQQPTLLYEVIAHTLEEEVRALRTELHRRLGGELGAVPPEGGDFG